MMDGKQLLSLRVSPSMLDRLDEWRRTQKDLPSRPVAAIRMLDQHLPRDDKVAKRQGRVG